jgi:hypothetical protein
LAHVPFADPAPRPQELLSQSPFLWHSCALVVHVPAVALVPVPHVPFTPHCALVWQTVPAAHDPVWSAPPHVPSPQSVVAWHVVLLHVPPPHVPFPHCEFDVQLIGWHVIPLHVPPLQSALVVHSQAPPTQARPVPQLLFLVQVVWPHVPTVAPPQANDEFGQSAAVPQGSLHWPTEPPVAPVHVAPKPQSTSLMHWFVLPTSAAADTWKSL